MNFTVVWLPRALAELAAIWTPATDRTAVTEASFRIDQLLVNDPYHFGESRSRNERIGFYAPLVILYRVHFRERLVEVLSVGRFGHA